MHTKTHLYLRLAWSDATQASAKDVHRTEVFDDTVAVQWPLRPGEGLPSPFMGDAQHPVSIWHWKASWQERLDVAFAHPRTVRDEERFAQETTFRTGEAVGNLFSQPERVSSVESLIASGFGTLTTAKVQPVEGRGAWRNGRWHVVMRRTLQPQDPEASTDFRSIESISVAFAVWDGARQERDGMKSISVWQTLTLEQPRPWWRRLFGFGAQPARTQVARVEDRVAQEREPLITRGRQAFERSGCANCHGPEGRGGVRNANAAFGQEVPPLTPVARAFTKEELIEKIRQGSQPAKLDPKGAGPDRVMPGWHPLLGDEELEVLSAYLMSLAPEDEDLW